MANSNTVYVASDESGTFLFVDGRPQWEQDTEDPSDDGIWIESQKARLLLELSQAQAFDLLGFSPNSGECWDVHLVASLIKKEGKTVRVKGV